MYVYSYLRCTRACSLFCTPRTQMTRPHFQGIKELRVSTTPLPNRLLYLTLKTETPWPPCRCREQEDITVCRLSDLHLQALLSYLYRDRVVQNDLFSLSLTIWLPIPDGLRRKLDHFCSCTYKHCEQGIYEDTSGDEGIWTLARRSWFI
jgi:hypothetical protein